MEVILFIWRSTTPKQSPFHEASFATFSVPYKFNYIKDMFL